MNNITCRDCIYCGEIFLPQNRLRDKNPRIAKKYTITIGKGRFNYFLHICPVYKLTYLVDEKWYCTHYKENIFLKLMRKNINLKGSKQFDDINSSTKNKKEEVK
jgi:hypothetical protein